MQYSLFSLFKQPNLSNLSNLSSPFSRSGRFPFRHRIDPRVRFLLPHSPSAVRPPARSSNTGAQPPARSNTAVRPPELDRVALAVPLLVLSNTGVRPPALGKEALAVPLPARKADLGVPLPERREALAVRRLAALARACVRAWPNLLLRTPPCRLARNASAIMIPTRKTITASMILSA